MGVILVKRQDWCNSEQANAKAALVCWDTCRQVALYTSCLLNVNSDYKSNVAIRIKKNIYLNILRKLVLLRRYQYISIH